MSDSYAPETIFRIAHIWVIMAIFICILIVKLRILNTPLYQPFRYNFALVKSDKYQNFYFVPVSAINSPRDFRIRTPRRPKFPESTPPNDHIAHVHGLHFCFHLATCMLFMSLLSSSICPIQSTCLRIAISTPPTYTLELPIYKIRQLS